MKLSHAQALSTLLAFLLISAPVTTTVYADDSAYGPGTVSDFDPLRAPDVSAAQCTAQHWSTTNRSRTGTLLTMDQIQELNQKIQSIPETNTIDLQVLPEVFQGNHLKNQLSTFESPKKLYLGQEPVPESFYEAIRANIRNGYSQETMEIQYGIVTNRTLMKGLPEKEFLSDSPSDNEWDNEASSALLVNEPVVIYLATQDKAFYYVKGRICGGWVPSEDIAVCKNRSEWIEASTIEHPLVVTADSMTLEASSAFPESSEKMLTMGTILELCKGEETLVANRLPWNNYIAYLPCRNQDGSYYRQQVLIPAGRNVHVGYLTLNSENLLNLAFGCLGSRYGWGGMLNGRDCSSYVREIYLCFGLILPRNTTWQALIPTRRITLSDMSSAEKTEVLKDLAPGTIIQFPGHEMFFLGYENGHLYTINNVSSLVKSNDTQKLRVRSVIVNTLDTKRANGKTWLDEMKYAIIPWDAQN